MADHIRDNPDAQPFRDGRGQRRRRRRIITLSPGVITLSHTEVPEELEGQGLGSTIVRGVLAYRARART